MLFSLLARPQVPDGNCVMDLSDKIDWAKDELDRCYGAIAAAQLGLQRHVRPTEQPCSGGAVGNACFKLGANHLVDRCARERRETVIDSDDCLAVANQKPLACRVGYTP